jgi:hypothetical protein
MSFAAYFELEYRYKICYFQICGKSIDIGILIIFQAIWFLSSHCFLLQYVKLDWISLIVIHLTLSI